MAPSSSTSAGCSTVREMCFCQSHQFSSVASCSSTSASCSTVRFVNLISLAVPRHALLPQRAAAQCCQCTGAFVDLISLAVSGAWNKIFPQFVCAQGNEKLEKTPPSNSPTLIFHRQVPKKGDPEPGALHQCDQDAATDLAHCPPLHACRPCGGRGPSRNRLLKCLKCVHASC